MHVLCSTPVVARSSCKAPVAASRTAAVAPCRPVPPARALLRRRAAASPTARNHALVCRAELPASAEDAPLAKAEPPSVKKGDFCRVNKASFEGSVEALASHTNGVYTGLGYIFEDRGEVLEVQEYSKGTYALVAWVGISTAPAWLPVTMLEKVDKLMYQRI